MSSLYQIVSQAKKAYWACNHAEQEWIANILGNDLDTIQDALRGLMYPEQFVTPWEKELYESLYELMADLQDSEDDRHPESGKLYQSCKVAYQVLKKFSKEQERRLEARIQMEALSNTHP